MSYLVDTDVIIGWLKGRREDVATLHAIGQVGLAISIISYGEVYDGIYFGRNPEASERAFQDFLRWVDVLPLSRQMMKRFARIRGQLRQEGQRLNDSDILIAVTALDQELTLVTRNLRHFNRIPDLKLYQADS